VLAVKRRLAEQLSAREIARSSEVHCDVPDQAEAREQSLTASLLFLPTLVVLPLSFPLRPQPQIDQAADVSVTCGRAQADSLIPLQLPFPPVTVLAIGIELPNFMTGATPA
jgi:hypothetical protein